MARAFKFTEKIIFADVEDEVIAMSVEDGDYFAFGPEGSSILLALREGLDLDAVVVKLLEEYETDEATLREDVEAFVAELLENGLVEEIEA